MTDMVPLHLLNNKRTADIILHGDQGLIFCTNKGSSLAVLGLKERAILYTSKYIYIYIYIYSYYIRCAFRSSLH